MLTVELVGLQQVVLRFSGGINNGPASGGPGGSAANGNANGGSGGNALGGSGSGAGGSGANAGSSGDAFADRRSWRYINCRRYKW